MYLFFDVETNGKATNFHAPMTKLDNWPRVTQLAYILYSEQGDKIHAYSNLVKPDGWEIPKEKFFIDNGMSTERNEKEGVEIKKLLENFCREISDNICEYLIAHNISFDYNCLGAEMIRANVRACKKLTQICTMKSSTDFCHLINNFSALNYKWPKLEELHEKLFGVKFDGAHDALADVEATAKCFFELVDRKIIVLEPRELIDTRNAGSNKNIG